MSLLLRKELGHLRRAGMDAALRRVVRMSDGSYALGQAVGQAADRKRKKAQLRIEQGGRYVGHAVPFRSKKTPVCKDRSMHHQNNILSKNYRP